MSTAVHRSPNKLWRSNSILKLWRLSIITDKFADCQTVEDDLFIIFLSSLSSPFSWPGNNIWLQPSTKCNQFKMFNAIRSLYRTEQNAVGESYIFPVVLLAFILFMQLMHPYLFRDSATNITSPRQPPLINSLRKCGNIRLFGAFKGTWQ